MRIVYIYQSFASKAGMERILSDKMNYLVRHYGYEVTFITYEQGKHPLAFELDKRINLLDLDVRFFPLYKLNPITRFFKKRKYLRLLISRLDIILNKINPDYVVLTTYDFDKFNSILTLPYRFVVESHICMSDIRQELRQNNFLRRYFAKTLDNNCFKYLNNATCMVCLTKDDKQEWEKRIQIPIHVIPNIVSKIPDNCSPYSERPNRILCVGRLTKQKGFDYLIKAWSIIAPKYPDWRIDIFGNGVLENEIHNMIEEYNLSQSVKINKPTGRIYDEYDNSSIYILSSRYEGFALVLLEAMSCGVPCIVFDCPHGPSELISNGENGVVVPLANVEKMAEAIEWMINHKDARVRMSEKARLSAKQYSAEIIMPQWVKLFDEYVG